MTLYSGEDNFNPCNKYGQSNTDPEISEGFKGKATSLMR